MNDFLPNDYKLPETSNYMKFEEGANTFRVLSSAIIGNEFWQYNEDGKATPVRRRMDEPITGDELQVNPQTGEIDPPKHFWAFVVWNREAEKIQILEITQKGIQKDIKALTSSPKWGDPKEYDICVTRTGKGKQTEYSVMPEPKEKLDEGIIRLYKDMKIDLEALFSNGDPFASTSKAEKIADDVEKILGE